MAFRRLVSAPVCAVLLGFVATGPFVSLATAAGRSSAPIEQRVLGDLLLGRLSANNEWAPPTGRCLNTQPIGWVLLVHGGGWIATGKTYMEMLDAAIAGYLRSLGWGVYMVDYRPLGNAFWDTVAGFDYMAARLGPRPRICVWGDSAGAQLAMMLAAIRPRVSCVISEAGPTDLTTMASQRAFPSRAANVTTAQTVIDDGAIPAFGRNHLWRWSSVRVARRIRVPLLLAGSSTDPTVPERPQMAEMKRVRPQTATMLLAGADESRGIALTHAFVTPAAYAAYHAAIARMLNGLVGRA